MFYSENHIEVTGIVRGPPKVIYTGQADRPYAIVKLSTATGILLILPKNFKINEKIL